MSAPRAVMAGGLLVRADHLLLAKRSEAKTLELAHPAYVGLLERALRREPTSRA